MLVLTRKVGERILIGDRVFIEITSIRGEKVRLGIDAPPEVVVRRIENGVPVEKRAQGDNHDGR